MQYNMFHREESHLTTKTNSFELVLNKWDQLELFHFLPFIKKNYNRNIKLTLNRFDDERKCLNIIQREPSPYWIFTLS